MCPTVRNSSASSKTKPAAEPKPERAKKPVTNADQTQARKAQHTPRVPVPKHEQLANKKQTNSTPSLPSSSQLYPTQDSQGEDSTDIQLRITAITELARRLLMCVRSTPGTKDLTPTQMVVLASLHREPLRIGVLASITGAAQNTISEVVERLKRAGLVSKLRNPHDQRVVLVDLTTKDRTILEQRHAAMVSAHRRLLRDLNAEQRVRFVESLEFVVQMAERAQVIGQPPPSARSK